MLFLFRIVLTLVSPDQPGDGPQSALFSWWSHRVPSRLVALTRRIVQPESCASNVTPVNLGRPDIPVPNGSCWLRFTARGLNHWPWRAQRSPEAWLVNHCN